MENAKESFDYEAVKKKTLEQFRPGKSLFGKDGAFAPMLKDFLESALEAEMDAHLDDEQRQPGNRKNGHGKKLLKTGEGSFELSTPRDRDGGFEPQVVRKGRPFWPKAWRRGSSACTALA